MSMSLWTIIKGLLVQDETDRTKSLSLEVDATATTGTQTTLKAAQTANRILILPNASDTLMGKATVDIMTNKSFNADGTGNSITNIENADIKAAAGIDATKLADGSVSNAEYQRINSLTSNAQDQLDANALTISNHLSDASDAHDASAISNVPSGNLAATDVQGALNELQSDVDGRQPSGNYITALTGDVTASGPGSVAATIANDAVSNAKLANMAAHTFKGNNTASPGDPLDLSKAELTAELNVFTSGLQGVVPASGGGTTNFLRADGTWAAGGSGANTTLSNLTSPTAVNQNLLPDSSASARDIGSDTKRWDEVFATQVDLLAPNPFLYLEEDTNNAYSFIYATIPASNGSGSASANTSVWYESTSQSGTAIVDYQGDLDIFTGGLSNASGNVFIGSGNAGANNSGNLTLRTGTSAATRGKVKITDGSEGTAGHVWTSTDTLGNGAWAAAAGGGANTALSNLVAPTAVNVDLRPGTDLTQSLGTSSFRWVAVECFRTISRDVAGTKALLTSGDLSLAGNTHATGGVAWQSSSADPLYIETYANATADANPTNDVTLYTGNKTAGTGNSGNINLTPGTSAGGTRGKIKIADGTEGTTGDVWTSTDVNGSGAWVTPATPTITVLTSGSAATYNTPANAKWLKVRSLGGGGGGGGSGTGVSGNAGTSGNATTFAGGATNLSAGGGTGGNANGNGAGGNGGVSTGGDLNFRGGIGHGTSGNDGGFTDYGGCGASSALAGGGTAGNNAPGTGGAADNNTGGGGGGAGGTALVYAATGGGSGGYLEKLIVTPDASYTYTIGGGGAGGAAGTSGNGGGAGGSGIIIIEEFY